MAWPVSNGDWDRALTAPGASFADITTILSGLCRAVNERREQMFGSVGVAGDHWDWIPGDTVDFFHTGEGTSGASAAFPLASQWDGEFRRALIPNTLRALKDAIEQVVNHPVVDWMDGASPWSFSALWSAATSGRTWDPDTFWWADNYLALKAALDNLTVVKCSGEVGSVVYQQFPGGSQSAFADPGAVSFAFSEMVGAVSSAVLTFEFGAVDDVTTPRLLTWVGHFEIGAQDFTRNPFSFFNQPGQTTTETETITSAFQGLIDAGIDLSGSVNSAAAGGFTGVPSGGAIALFDVDLAFTRDVSAALTDQA